MSQTITAAVVSELRRKTGAGMMDCKEALSESAGDVEKAIEFLRKKGKAAARKRADRSANEGVIVAVISPDGHEAALLEVNSETDFVARNADFQAFANKIVNRVLEWKDGDKKSVADLLALPSKDGAAKTVGDELTDLIGTIGEKLEIRRYARRTDKSGIFGTYIHSNSKLGVLLDIDGADSNDADVQMLAKDLCMQVAAASPLYVHRQEIPADKLDVEKNIIAEQVKGQGKPPQVVEKIVAGKLNKYYAEVCLVDQAFVKDSNLTIGDIINQVAQKSGKSLAVRSFVRFQIGE
ncbi:translation elongation factor Ts [bacterium]|nr:translation elongation factor Ts [bacterium]